jgi:hypothetical protein
MAGEIRISACTGEDYEGRRGAWRWPNLLAGKADFPYYLCIIAAVSPNEIKRSMYALFWR